MAKHKISRRFNEQVEWKFRKQLNANLLSKPGSHNCIMVLDGLNPSHNIGKIFRSAEIFSINAIHLINTPLFNVSPAKGAFKRVPTLFFDHFNQSNQKLTEQGYEIFALTPAQPEYQTSFLHQTQLPEKTAFVMGHEQNGLSFNPKDYPLIKPLSIKQFGITESLNVAVAASLCLYEYTNQINR